MRKPRFKVDESIARDQEKKIGAYIEKWRARFAGRIPGESNSISYILAGLAAENYPPDAATDALARFVASQQQPDGQWQAFAHRPPMGGTDIAITAVAEGCFEFKALLRRKSKYQAAAR